MLAKPLLYVAGVSFALTLLISCQTQNSGDTIVKTIDGYTFRDLNKNGKLDVYEDTRQPVSARVNDLLGQMTLDEKAGMLFINGARINEDGSVEDRPATGMFAFAPNGLNLVKQKKMNHFNLWQVPSPAAMAKWYNAMQRYVQDSTRLGIPITIASDPRNHFSNNIFAMTANTFSQWCEPLGLGAIGSDSITHEFADISRREYLAVGIREALHPQVDLATEPRWPRISGTFGEDAQLTARMAKAYILGYQGDKLELEQRGDDDQTFPRRRPAKRRTGPALPLSEGTSLPRE